MLGDNIVVTPHAYEFYQLTKVLCLPVDDYFLALDIEDPATQNKSEIK